MTMAEYTVREICKALPPEDAAELLREFQVAAAELPSVEVDAVDLSDGMEAF